MRATLLLSLTMLLGGCAGKICTLVGCSGSYLLTFEADTWADGDYTLSVSFDGMEPEVCTFTLPLAGDALCAGVPVALEDGALQINTHTPMDESLVEADITLSLDGAELLAEVAEPAWGAPNWPNGQECDDGYGCLSAEQTFSL